jgi:hypothetical protein
MAASPRGKKPSSDKATELATLTDAGKAPKERLKDANALHSIYRTFLQADQVSAHNRAILQADADGAAPENQSALNASGMGWNYNLNWLGGDTKLQAALVAYSDLIDSTSELITPEFHPKEIAPEEMQDASDVISEEFSKLVRESSDFYSTWERLGSEFTKFGVGFAYFSDEETPWWDAAGWNEFKMPRKTKVGDEKIPILTWEHDYRVHELWKFIEDPKHTNWDTEMVQKAIVYACRTPTKDRPWQTFWNDIQESLKNNDIGFSYGQVEEVHALKALVRELDGSVSFYVGLINGSNERHLYKDRSRYEKMTRAVVTFTLGVGNGTYHSIRGLLWKMLPFNQAINRVNNRLLTQTELSMSLMLQAKDSENLDDMAITLTGAVAYLPPEDKATVVTRTLPDVGTQGLPVLDRLDGALSNATGQFQASTQGGTGETDKRHNISKGQFMTEREERGSLTNNSVNRFYRSLDTVSAEQFRRAQKIGPKSAKYPEVADFFKRCDERGVPAEIIQKAVRTVKARRAIGNGSPSMRAAALDRLQSMQGAFDEAGRNMVTRDVVALYAGRQAADRYCPRQKRIAPDAQIAVLENTVLRNGPLDRTPGQNDSVHASVHVPAFLKGIQQLVAVREQDPSADFTPLRPEVDYLFNLHDHAAQHVEAMAVDPMRLPDAKSYQAALQQGGNLLAGFARELQSQERHAVDAQQQPGQPAGQQPGQPAAGPSVEELDKQKKFAEINASTHNLEFAAQRDQQTLRHAEENHALDMQLASAKVAEAAQKIRERDIELAAKVRDNAAKAKSVAAS